MKRLLFAAALVLLTAPAVAQDKTALATQYVNMPGVQNMMTEMFSPTAMADQMAATLPANITLSEEQKQKIGVVMSDAMSDLRPRLEELMVTGVADTFSAGELQALIDFYSSEHGATVMKKMAPFMTTILRQLQPEMHELQRKITPEIVRILQE